MNVDEQQILSKLLYRLQRDKNFVTRMAQHIAAQHPRCILMTPISLYQGAITPSVNGIRTNFFKALRRTKSKGHILVIPLQIWDLDWCYAHANFLVGDLRTSTFVRFEPHGSIGRRHQLASRVDVERPFFTMLQRVVGHINIYPLAWSCPLYGIQWTQQLAFQNQGIDLSGLCVLMSLVGASAFLKHVCHDKILQPDEFVDAFRVSQLEAGASNSPFDVRSKVRVMAAIKHFVNTYREWIHV